MTLPPGGNAVLSVASRQSCVDHRGERHVSTAGILAFDSLTSPPRTATWTRYRSPVSGMTVTMSLPSFSGRRAISRAAQTAAPPEMPVRIPSSLQRRRAISPPSSCFTGTTSSRASCRAPWGRTPAPALDLVRPGLPARDDGRVRRLGGDDLQRRLAGLHHLRAAGDRPSGPVPQTRMSTWPSVSRQISSAVVRRWMSGLAGFSNCWRMR